MLPFGPAAQDVEAAQLQMQIRQKQIAAFVEQGYIVRDGATVRSKLAFKDGRFTLNGLPINPMAMQPVHPLPPAAAMPPPRPVRR
jgi:uncharacterized protein YdgA (DUF945 family)